MTSREERRRGVLRGVFGAKRDEVREEWRKLHTEELRRLYCSPTIVRVIKSRKTRRPNILHRMTASIASLQSDLNFFLNRVLVA
jgi:hypothetical protein